MIVKRGAGVAAAGRVVAGGGRHHRPSSAIRGRDYPLLGGVVGGARRSRRVLVIGYSVIVLMGRAAVLTVGPVAILIHLCLHT